MNKPLCVISCPIDTFSGYGSRSRDFVKQLVRVKGEQWDIKILPQRWGNTPWNYINAHKEEWGWLNSHLLPGLQAQPDYWFQITIPSEFQPVGKWNCGVTAGIETTMCDASWIEGCNRMNLTLVSSQFAKQTFVNTKYEKKNQQTGQTVGTLQLQSPVEVLFEGVDISKFFKSEYSDTPLVSDLDTIKESFCFLVVGHWLPGDMGQDRKNIPLTIKTFLEAYKNSNKDVALVLKISLGGASIMDRDEVIKRISDIEASVGGKLPSVYLLHGELDEKEMNVLYNHPKIKAMVTLTKGEGYGRPLIEFSQTKKPIVATAWSGHLDFLTPQGTFLIGGSITQVHHSAAQANMILNEAGWFSPSVPEIMNMWDQMHKNYKSYLEPSKIQAYKIKTEFNLDKMGDRLQSLLSIAPEFKAINLPQLPQLKLPTLKKV